jgi:hypothetical protein
MATPEKVSKMGGKEMGTAAANFKRGYQRPARLRRPPGIILKYLI